MLHADVKHMSRRVIFLSIDNVCDIRKKHLSCMKSGEMKGEGWIAGNIYEYCTICMHDIPRKVCPSNIYSAGMAKSAQSSLLSMTNHKA